MPEIELPGLDGSNLLAYLAALGTLRVLTLAEPDRCIRMSWVDRGNWIPVLNGTSAETDDELLDLLAHRVCGEESVNEAWRIGKDLTLSCAEFGDRMREFLGTASPRDRATADFLAAFGSDVYGSGPKKEMMSDTAFRTMSGAGHQHFLGFMLELAADTGVEHLQRSLLVPWDYADSRPSLRWDAADFRPHALRAEDPAADPIKTMRGANRLAVEALPLFPAVAHSRRVRTTAFQEGESGTEVRWPIWIEALELETVASLIATSGGPVRPGIVQMYRATRFTEGKYRNFSPSKAM
jgi:hypothetical protein